MMEHGQIPLGADTGLRDLIERLIADDPQVRCLAVDQIQQLDGIREDPILIYLLASRLTDPDLGVRLEVVKLLGGMLDLERSPHRLTGRPLQVLVSCLAEFEEDQFVKLLEVSDSYLAAETPLANLLQTCSYAGRSLVRIVNDRKLPVGIRQQAIFFCGEVGFMNTVSALRALLSRVEKARRKPGGPRESRTRRDLEALYTHAVSALSKLEV